MNYEDFYKIEYYEYDEIFELYFYKEVIVMESELESIKTRIIENCNFILGDIIKVGLLLDRSSIDTTFRVKNL